MIEKTTRYWKIPLNWKNTEEVVEISKPDLSGVVYPTNLILDQATKMGYSLYDNKRRLIKTVTLLKDTGMDLVEFRVKLRQELEEVIDKYQVERIFLEDVFGGINHQTTLQLSSIKEMIEDLAFAKEIKAYPLNNKKWKKLLSHPDKWDTTKNDKDEVARYVKEAYPKAYLTLKDEEHVIDTLGMAIAIFFRGKKATKELTTKFNKTLPLNLDVKVLNSLGDLENLIRKSKSKKHLGEVDIDVVDYDTKESLEDNFRRVLSNRDIIVIAEIPYHRYYGQILLRHNIKPKDIGETGTIVGIATRKTRR